MCSSDLGEVHLRGSKYVNSRVSFYGLLDGQYSGDVLLVSEEVGYGGGRIGKGYNTSEVTGDKGIGGLLGFQYRLESMVRYLHETNYYLNVDGGKVWNNSSSSMRSEELSSLACGVRMLFKKGLTVNLEIAQPVYRYPDIRVSKSPRAFAMVYWQIK